MRSMQFTRRLVLFMLAAMPAGVGQAQDWLTADQQAAKTWGMQAIAMIQAEAGDIQGAKHTLAQIDQNGPPGPCEVTVVSFENGIPFYKTPGDVVSFAARNPIRQTISDVIRGDRKSPGWGGRDAWGTQYFLAVDRPANCVPAQTPAGLPAGYLDADPRHGALIDFTDERDSRGTRVTSRKYADGYVMIETPGP
jgi:hypothetical protein